MRSAVRSMPALEASPRSSTVGRGESSGLDVLEGGEDAGGVVESSAEGADHEKVGLGLGEHHPLAAAGAHQRACGEIRGHRFPLPWWCHPSCGRAYSAGVSPEDIRLSSDAAHSVSWSGVRFCLAGPSSEATNSSVRSA